MRLRFLLPVVLTVLLALSSARYVFASVEIAYDDGSSAGSTTKPYLGVKFTAPWDSARLMQITVYLTAAMTKTVYVTMSDHTTVIASFTVTAAGLGWVAASVPGGGVVVPKDFFVVIGVNSLMGWDVVYDSGRSYEGTSLAALAPYGTAAGDLSLHAYVDPVSSPVGGVITRANTFFILAPYLAIISLVTIATSVYIKKRER